MHLYVHDFIGNESGIVCAKQGISVLEKLAKTYRYSLDGEAPRNLDLSAKVLDTILELRNPFDSTKTLFLSTKSETSGCLQAMIWRPVVNYYDDLGKFDIAKNQDPAYELKTMVFPAVITHRGDFANKGLNGNEEPLLLAFHTSADKNMMEVMKLELEANRLFSDQLARRGRKIRFISEIDFQSYFNNTPTGYLGIEKGEINPFSIIEVARAQNLPLLTLVDSDIANRTQAIATNFCRRTLSVRFASGRELAGMLVARGVSEDIARLNIIDGIVLPAVSIVQSSKFFYRPPARGKLDDGWTWDPAANIAQGRA